MKTINVNLQTNKQKIFFAKKIIDMLFRNIDVNSNDEHQFNEAEYFVKGTLVCIESDYCDEYLKFKKHINGAITVIFYRKGALSSVYFSAEEYKVLKYKVKKILKEGKFAWERRIERRINDLEKELQVEKLYRKLNII